MNRTHRLAFVMSDAVYLISLSLVIVNLVIFRFVVDDLSILEFFSDTVIVYIVPFFVLILCGIFYASFSLLSRNERKRSFVLSLMSGVLSMLSVFWDIHFLFIGVHALIS